MPVSDRNHLPETEFDNDDPMISTRFKKYVTEDAVGTSLTQA